MAGKSKIKDWKLPFRITASQGKGLKCRTMYDSLKSWDYFPSEFACKFKSEIEVKKITNKTVSSYLKTAFLMYWKTSSAEGLILIILSTLLSVASNSAKKVPCFIFKNIIKVFRCWKRKRMEGWTMGFWGNRRVGHPFLSSNH